MKLNFPNLQQKPPTKSVPSRLRVSKSGIYMNRQAAETLGWKEGDKVIIAEDETNPGDWYILKHENGVALGKSKKSGDLGFCRVMFYSFISEKLGFTGRYTFLIAANAPIHHEGNVLYAIITAPLLKERREAEARKKLEEANQRTQHRLTATA